MTTTFLHGVKTNESVVGTPAIGQVPTAIIGIVGTAPVQLLAVGDKKINTPFVVRGQRDIDRFIGPETAGYTLPGAVRDMLAEGASIVVVTNVFDPAVHKDVSNAPDPTKVLPADIVGAVTAGVYTGLQTFLTCKGLFGFKPKILLSPGFSTDTTVETALDTMAGKLAGIALIDIPLGSTPTDVIDGRGGTGTLAISSASERLNFCYPQLAIPDPSTPGSVLLRPYSQLYAGVIARTDQEDGKGCWWSPSNKKFRTVVALERPLTCELNDANSDVNLLNAQGVVTAMSVYGEGFRTWGNRNAAYPTLATDVQNRIKSFTSVRRTADLIEDSMETASLKYMDQPIIKATIDSLLEDGNAFMRSLKGKSAIYDGQFFFDPNANPTDQLNNGQLAVGYRFLPPAPLEELDYNSYIDLTLNSAGKR